MGASVKPAGNLCNLACQYCYQNVLRDAGQRRTRFDFERVRAALEDAAEPFDLFGGEPLLLPVQDLERLFAYGLERYGHNGIQTNGALIDEHHIALFQRYRVAVGISIDGPGELNDARWAGSLARTRAATARTLAAIERLIAAGIKPSLMIQLTRANGLGPELDRLCQWLVEMDGKGIPAARIHVLEMDGSSARESYGLTVQENVTALRRLARAADRFVTLQLDLMTDQRQLLLMDDEAVTCVFRACDPLFTEAVFSVTGTGAIEKCGLTDRDGVNFERPRELGFERYLALAQTPQEAGGCRGCRFLALCKGQCPGTGIGGDWRNRSENCEVWREIFTVAEDQLVAEGAVPLSLHPRRSEVEAKLMEAWAGGENPTLASVRAELALVLKRSTQESVNAAAG